MLIYEKDNKLNIDFNNKVDNNPDLQIENIDNKTSILINGEEVGGSTAFATTPFDDYDYKDLTNATPGGGQKLVLGISKNSEDCFFCVDDWEEKIQENNFFLNFYAPIYNIMISGIWGKQSIESNVNSFISNIDTLISKGVMPNWSNTSRYLAINYIDEGIRGYLLYSATTTAQGMIKTINIRYMGMSTGRLIAIKKVDGSYLIQCARDGNIKEYTGTNMYFKKNADGYSEWIAENKLDTNLGAANAGKVLSIDSSGNIVPVDIQTLLGG